MKLETERVLKVEKDDGCFYNCFTLTNGDACTIYLKDGNCIAAELNAVNEETIEIFDEDNEPREILFEEIDDIEEG